MPEKKYGYIGWKEFLESRQEMLDSYDRAKGRNQSRPVRTEHGVIAEGVFRKWLGNLLPDQFGVTSGYVIPSLLATSAYRLLHYDVIIYDRLSAPVLWVDGGDDTSEQGKSRAIPAEHVRAIYEIKSSFNKKATKEAIQKLQELGDLKTFFIEPFHSGIVFFELPRSMVKKTQILKHLLPDSKLVNYTGGMILRCDLNIEMTALFRPFAPSEETEESKECLVPLAKDIESLAIHENPQGQPTISEQGAGLLCFSDGTNWHFSKLYGPIVRDKSGCIHLNWSYNGFSTFALDLLAYLRGQQPHKPGFHFARVFDRIDPPNN